MALGICWMAPLAAGAETKLEDPTALCRLAEQLLVYSQPGEDELGCVTPFALTSCGRKAITSDGRAVFRILLVQGEESIDLLQEAGACTNSAVVPFRPGHPMPPDAESYIQVFLRKRTGTSFRFTMNLGSPPDRGHGCGQFYGVAGLSGAKWNLKPTRRDGTPIRAFRGQKCEFKRDDVLQGKIGS